jgi:hypothetical protein
MILNSPELIQRCPFCSGVSELIQPVTKNYKFVQCKICLATGPKSVNEEYAIQWWNERNQKNINRGLQQD